MTGVQTCALPIFLQSDIKNRNGRVYPNEILHKEVTRYNREFINKNRAFGELGHPDGPVVNLERVSHMITKLHPDGQNFIGEAKIMNTPYGKIVKGLIDEGAQLGVSSRGMGSLCHEFFHSMGAPDLYHYNDNAAPTSAGGWDVMDEIGRAHV